MMTIHSPSRPHRIRSFSWLAIFLLLANGFLIVSGQTQTSTETVKEDEELGQPEWDLESMSDAELELICVERGFELMRDPSLGELTHEDFVDAASRCLAIEKDMNEILNQNPDLAEELVGEIDRMKEEKERLEAEQKEMLAQKEKLEQQLKHQQEISSGGGTRMWGSALDGSSNNSKQSTSTSSTTNDNAGASLTDDIRSSTIESAYDTYQDSDASQEEAETEVEEEDPCDTNSNSTSAATQDGSSKSTDFSLKGFLQEVMTEFEKDVTRMTSLILPVLRPIYSAGNKAWSYVKWVFRSARKHYQKYAPKQEQPTQKQEKGNPLDA